MPSTAQVRRSNVTQPAVPSCVRKSFSRSNSVRGFFVTGLSCVRVFFCDRAELRARYSIDAIFY